jgi:hypothetical protein
LHASLFTVVANFVKYQKPPKCGGLYIFIDFQYVGRTLYTAIASSTSYISIVLVDYTKIESEERISKLFWVKKVAEQITINYDL